MFTVIVVLVHLQLASVLEQWTWIHHLAIWGSVCEWPRPAPTQLLRSGPADRRQQQPAATRLAHAPAPPPAS